MTTMMTTTPAPTTTNLTNITNTITNTNNEEDAHRIVVMVVRAVVDAKVVDLEEEARKKEKAEEEERNDEARCDKWIDRLESAQFRVLKRARVALKEETDAVRAAAMRARLRNGLDTFFYVGEEREVTRLAPLVEECLDDVRARAVQRGWAPLAQHWKRCLPKGVLASAAMQQYMLRWAAADAAADS